MAEPPPYPGMPRWVKVSGIIVIVLVLFVAILILTGGGPGRHGPGRHMPSGDADGQTPPSSVAPGPLPSGGPGGNTPRGGGN